MEVTGNHPACRADKESALTSNATLKQLFRISDVAGLIVLTPDQKTNSDKSRYVTFQNDISVSDSGREFIMRPRTLEEAFVYDNFGHYRDEKFKLGITIPTDLNEAYDAIYERIKSNSFKKTDFAMNVLASKEAWQVPAYIVEGLKWLELRLHPTLTPAATEQ